MIIRQEQTKALEQVAVAGYVEKAVAHLQLYDPAMAAAAGKPGLELLARKGLAAARNHGFNEDRTLQLYLELMMSLGCGFDTDPQFRWLHPFLEPVDGIPTIERARLLHFHATAYLDRAFGESREYGRAAIERAAAIRPDRLKQLGADLDATAKRVVDWLHPQRMEFVDADAVHDLVAGARQAAGKARLPQAEGAALLFLLKFTFGHMVCSDPLYPWLERQLANPDPGDESERMERLVVRAQTYLTMMQRNFKEGGTDVVLFFAQRSSSVYGARFRGSRRHEPSRFERTRGFRSANSRRGPRRTTARTRSGRPRALHYVRDHV